MLLRIETSDKFLLWFLKWMNRSMTVKELAETIEAYQRNHPDFVAYEGDILNGYGFPKFQSDIVLLKQFGCVEISEARSLEENVVMLTPFGDLSAAVFEPHWADAKHLEPNSQ